MVSYIIYGFIALQVIRLVIYIYKVHKQGGSWRDINLRIVTFVDEIFPPKLKQGNYLYRNGSSRNTIRVKDVCQKTYHPNDFKNKENNN